VTPGPPDVGPDDEPPPLRCRAPQRLVEHLLELLAGGWDLERIHRHRRQDGVPAASRAAPVPPPRVPLPNCLHGTPRIERNGERVGPAGADRLHRIATEQHRSNPSQQASQPGAPVTSECDGSTRQLTSGNRGTGSERMPDPVEPYSSRSGKPGPPPGAAAPGETRRHPPQTRTSRSTCPIPARRSPGRERAGQAAWVGHVGARNPAYVMRPADTRGVTRRCGRVVESYGSRLLRDGGVAAGVLPGRGCGAADGAMIAWASILNELTQLLDPGVGLPERAVVPTTAPRLDRSALDRHRGCADNGPPMLPARDGGDPAAGQRSRRLEQG